MEIVEFQNKFTEDIKHVAFSALRGVGIRNQSIGAILKDRDGDLDKILEIYHGRGRFWVAIQNEKIIGTVGIKEIDETTAKLKRMFVLPERQGQGVGQALLEHALSFAKTQGYTKIVLRTDRLMTGAHAFYEKNDFKRAGEDEERFCYEKLIG